MKPRQAGFATPPVERIQHETLQKRVYGQLRTAFLESRFMPGQTLTMRALADMTGTSVQPVREALQRLCAEGALEWLPNTAFRVPGIDPLRYRELWEIRKLLEGHATMLAAARIQPAEVAQLKSINDEMRAAMRRGDAERTLKLNRDFHFTVYRAAKSPVLVNLIEMIWMQVSPLFAAFTYHELGLPRSGLSERLAAGANDFFSVQEAVIDSLSKHKVDDASNALRRQLELSTTLFTQEGPADVPPEKAQTAGRRSRASKS
ncbi:MAG TPA: GntR family transcriptional regulator [Steroidobacteraceae bacterium]|nr:GntR family transcriptional regulator [Steroidobacteraceae bacterium]